MATDEEKKLIDGFDTPPSRADHATLITMIKVLMENGLETKVEPFPETDKEFSKILDQLRGLEPDQLKEKLIESGWLLHPYGEDEMRCQECMYYLVHKRWCDLPELDLPAEPDWWCRLWRI